MCLYFHAAEACRHRPNPVVRLFPHGRVDDFMFHAGRCAERIARGVKRYTGRTAHELMKHYLFVRVLSLFCIFSHICNVLDSRLYLSNSALHGASTIASIVCVIVPSILNAGQHVSGYVGTQRGSRSRNANIQDSLFCSSLQFSIYLSSAVLAFRCNARGL